MTGAEKMDRLSRRILGLMIVVGGLLTILSFSMHVDGGRFKARFDSIIDRASSVAVGNKAPAR
jgi:hypothetical protein